MDRLSGHRPRNVGWARAAALLYGDWGTSKAYVIGGNSSQFIGFNTNFKRELVAQARIAAALAQGHSVTVAAREAGVHRTTIHHWFRHEPAFQAGVLTARPEYLATCVTK